MKTYVFKKEGNNACAKSGYLNDLASNNDLAAAVAGASILLGDHLGIYQAIDDAMPVTYLEVAKRRGWYEHYVRESVRAGGARVNRLPADKNTLSVSPEQATAFAEQGSPTSLPSMSFSPAISMSRRSQNIHEGNCFCITW